MERHVKYSYELLSSMDWPYDLRNVPKIASSHHEKLDGSGYPCGKDAESLGVTERVMMIVDMYDALTAKDRPYKKAMTAEKALSIIEFDVKAGKLDKEIYDIFVEKREEIEREVKRVIAKKQFDG
jgi:HD-GYP domain-containing protein (c-di-GMP phosphodiesterase class II)